MLLHKFIALFAQPKLPDHVKENIQIKTINHRVQFMIHACSVLDIFFGAA
jgi:hypothetical protein